MSVNTRRRGRPRRRGHIRRQGERSGTSETKQGGQ